jgi:AcrR family transcriptional regulator
MSSLSRSAARESERPSGDSSGAVATLATSLEEVAPSGQRAIEDNVRPMRADARRNYDRLLAAAKEVFSEHGASASLEAIAKQAGVGVGTLYRHFPTRIDLVEAVYRNDLDQLVRAAEETLELDPWSGVVSWLEAFVRYAEGKRILLSELHEAFEKNPQFKCESRDRINRATELVFSRAQDAGVIRTDIDGSDVMELIRPMCTSTTLGEGQATRLLGMVLDGLRAQPSSAT